MLITRYGWTSLLFLARGAQYTSGGRVCSLTTNTITPLASLACRCVFQIPLQQFDELRKLIEFCRIEEKFSNLIDLPRCFSVPEYSVYDILSWVRWCLLSSWCMSGHLSFLCFLWSRMQSIPTFCSWFQLRKKWLCWPKNQCGVLHSQLLSTHATSSIKPYVFFWFLMFLFLDFNCITIQCSILTICAWKDTFSDVSLKHNTSSYIHSKFSTSRGPSGTMPSNRDCGICGWCTPTNVWKL